MTERSVGNNSNQMIHLCASGGRIRTVPHTAGSSHASAAAEPYRDTSVFHDHRDLAPSMRVLQHARESCGIPLDVDVLERNAPPGVVLTGGLGVGSGVLSEDQNHLRAS